MNADVPPKIDRVLETYRNALEVERDAAANTIVAYARDLDRYVGFLVDHGFDDLARVRPADLMRFLERLHDEGLAARSRARMLSAARAAPLGLRDRRGRRRPQP